MAFSQPKIKDGTYVINLDNINSKGTLWVSLFINENVAVYFYFFAIEYIFQEVLNKINDKFITRNKFRTQDNESIMRRVYCNALIECFFAGKTLLDHSCLFSLNDYKRNDKIICNYFKDKYGRTRKSGF